MSSFFAMLAAKKLSAAGEVQFVGGHEISFVGSSGSLSVPLNALTGGIGSAPQLGDLIVVYYGGQSVSAPSGAYTNQNIGVADTTYDARSVLSYKISDGTETEIVYPSGTGNGAHSAAAAVHVWRGINGIAPVTSIADDSGLGLFPNPPSVTVASDEFVIAMGTNCSSVAGHSLTTSDLSNFFSADAVNDGRESATAMGSAAPAAGTFNPAAFGTDFGTSSSSYSWAAATMVVKKG